MKSKTGQESKYREHLLSDINIYLAIYSLNSYIFEYNILKPEDRHLYHQLQDKFDERLVSKVTEDVKKRIKQLLDDPDKFIQAKVYFKPKKLVDGKLEFRPLHTTDLITQIAIVSMLHLFVYEIPEKENPKLTLSNLSRLIPSDFYGNRVSVKPESLFKPWKQQYQKYNQNSNDALKKYHTSLEYKYEVTLDLENFFPTINPVIIYHYIIGYLPAYLSEQDMRLMKTVLRKLLFCELDFGEPDTAFTKQLREQYLKISKHKTPKSNDDEQQNTVNTEKTGDAEHTETVAKLYKFVRGIPQGLPQSYFLGNIYMIIVSEIFRSTFTGVSYFYVDDSVIFTNDIQEDQFQKQLENINEQITKKEQEFLKKHQKENIKIYPQNTQGFYESNLYGVGLHLSGKSSYVRLDRLDESEVYLKCISRQMSQAGSDFFRMYSDEENRNLEKKFEILCQQVKAQLDKLEKQSQEKEKRNLPEPEVRDTKKFKDRLIRYYRFFKYKNNVGVAVKMAGGCSNLAKKVSSIIAIIDIRDEYKNFGGFLLFADTDKEDAAHISKKLKDELKEEYFIYQDNMVKAYEHKLCCKLHLFPTNGCGAIEKLLLECAKITYGEVFEDALKYRECISDEKYEKLRKECWAKDKDIQEFYADKVQFGAISTVLKPDKPVRFSIKDKLIRTGYKASYMEIAEFKMLYDFLQNNLEQSVD